MLDYISIKFENIDLSKIRKLQNSYQINSKGKQKITYYLPNKANDHSLSIIYAPDSSKLQYGDVIIEGSILKWYNGALSFDDLTIENELQAFQLIAERIGLSKEEFFEKVKLNIVEIGQNIITEVGADQYINAMTIQNKKTMYEYRNRGKAIFKTNLEIRLYDKILEMSSSKRRKFEVRLSKKEAKRLGKENLNYTRFEICVLNPTGVSQYLANGFELNNLNDLFNHYSSLIALWIREYKKILMIKFSLEYASIDFHKINSMKILHEIEKYFGLKAIGIEIWHDDVRKTQIKSSNKSTFLKNDIKMVTEMNPKDGESFILDFHKKVSTVGRNELRAFSKAKRNGVIGIR